MKPNVKRMEDILNKTILSPNDKSDHNFVILRTLWPSSKRRARIRGHFVEFLFTDALTHPPAHPHGITGKNSDFVIWGLPFWS